MSVLPAHLQIPDDLLTADERTLLVAMVGTQVHDVPWFIGGDDLERLLDQDRAVGSTTWLTLVAGAWRARWLAEVEYPTAAHRRRLAYVQIVRRLGSHGKRNHLEFIRWLPEAIAFPHGDHDTTSLIKDLVCTLISQGTQRTIATALAAVSTWCVQRQHHQQVAELIADVVEALRARGRQHPDIIEHLLSAADHLEACAENVLLASFAFTVGHPTSLAVWWATGLITGQLALPTRSWEIDTYKSPETFVGWAARVAAAQRWDVFRDPVVFSALVQVAINGALTDRQDDLGFSLSSESQELAQMLCGQVSAILTCEAAP
jgi:hypothetical protein